MRLRRFPFALLSFLAFAATACLREGDAADTFLNDSPVDGVADDVSPDAQADTGGEGTVDASGDAADTSPAASDSGSFDAATEAGAGGLVLGTEPCGPQLHSTASNAVIDLGIEQVDLMRRTSTRLLTRSGNRWVLLNTSTYGRVAIGD